MLLTIDAGNSFTKFGVFDREKLVEKFSVRTDRLDDEEMIRRQFDSRFTEKISAIVISTVVRELTDTFKNFGSSYFQVEPFFADHSFDYGFRIEYFPPESCGSDRLVAAFAAVEKFGAPVIVCDFGTATNIEVVDENRIYRGGVITPGINTFASGLFEKTSKLPQVDLIKPEKVIGNSTVTSIQSGIYFGYVGLVDGIIERILREIKTEPHIISTGGFAELIAAESSYTDIIEENLVLDGLRLIHGKIARF